MHVYQNIVTAERNFSDKEQSFYSFTDLMDNMVIVVGISLQSAFATSSTFNDFARHSGN